MNEHEFQSKLAELMGEISTLPQTERNKLEKLADETRQRHERLKQTVSGLQESLDYLRLSVKYLVFDLEATRRENQYLRRLLDRQHGRAQDTDDHPGDEQGACPSSARQRLHLLGGGRADPPPAVLFPAAPHRPPTAALRGSPLAPRILFGPGRSPRRRGGRVAEGDGLLNRYTAQKLYRGFESPPLRFP